MEPFRVLMVGADCAGKTSTLASMAGVIQQEVNILQYDTTIPDQLIHYHDEFLKVDDYNDIYLEQTPIKEGTGKRIDYSFDFFSQTHEKDISIDFIDVCSGWFIPPTQDIPNVHYDEVKDILKNSVVSMWCVDCVSMIEGKNDPVYGDLHEERNCPRIIAELYKNLDSIYPKHRLIFVLVRAETYHYFQSNDWLIKKFQENYNPYIAEIRQKFNDMEFYVVSIETLGNFKFNCWHVREYNERKVPIATFRRFGNKYAPKNCETPALLAIDRALKAAISYYESRKNENLEFYKRKWHTLPVRSLIKFRKLITGQWWSLNSETRAAEIYDLLKNGYPVPSEKYPRETLYTPDINAHIILKRIESAAGIMNETINRKKREGCFKML